MRFPRPIDSTLHGAVDYAVGMTLASVFPKLARLEGTRSARQVRAAGGFHLGYSTLTNYALGIVKLIPFKAHLVLDGVGAAALIATPFVSGQYRDGPREWVPHVALGMFELGSLAMTDPTGRGDYHGDAGRVRAANELDPHAQIHEGGPAVRRAATTA